MYQFFIESIFFLTSAMIWVMPKRVVFVVINLIVPILVTRRFQVANLLVATSKLKYQEYTRSKYGNDHVCCVDVPHGYKMYLPVSDNHFSHRKFGVYQERVLIRTLDRLCLEGATVCELGTHLGETTLYLANRVGARGKVFSFELDTKFCELLQMSLDANRFDHVVLENKVIGKPGYVSVGDGYCDFPTMMANFPELNYPSYLGTRFFTTSADDWNDSEIPRKRHIQVERVDLYDYFKGMGCSIDVFFMDIEGCEVFAIPMILRLGKLLDYRPKIIFEVHHNDYSGEQAWEIRNELLSAGYRLSSPDSRHIVCE